MESFEAIILLVVSGQGMLLSMGLISSVIKKSYSNFFLGLITLVVTLEMLNAWATHIQYHNSPRAFPFWIFGSYLILPPALLLFSRVNTQPAFVPNRKTLWWFAPAAVEIVVEFSAFYYYVSTGVSINLLQYTAWFAFTELLPVAGMAAAVVVYWLNLRRAAVRIKETNVVSGWPHLAKLYSLFGLFVLFTLLWILQVAGIHVFSIIEIVLSAFLFVLGYLGYFHPSFFEVPPLLKGKNREEFAQYNDDAELQRLLALFENEKLHRQPRLGLDDVAGKLKLPSRYVSGLVNTYHRTDFRNFVNRYRVNDVVERIKDPRESHKTLLALAMEAGFSSKSSFNQIFKTVTGQKPSDYLVK